MQDRWDVVVIGAGITGLAAAYELTRRRRDVVVLERSGVASQQSSGLARIFRVLHGDPSLCSLAMEAADGWRRWETELGTRRLLGDEGLVSIGPLVEVQRSAMQAAGAAVRSAKASDLDAALPFLRRLPDWDDGIIDPAAGVLRIRRAQEALAARLNVVTADAVRLVDGVDGIEVHLASGDVAHADGVLVCAGTATHQLAAQAGIELDVHWRHHVRLSYGSASGESLPRSAAFVLESAYGLPIGSTGRFALGLHDPGPPAPFDAATADDYAASIRRQHAAWIAEHLPAVDPVPIDEIRCVSLDAPWLDARGDGFVVQCRGRVVACTGSNMMKFGPVLGDRLARTMLAIEA